MQFEEAKDRAASLYRHVIHETEEQKLLLDEKNRMLEALSSKLSKYLAPQVSQSIFSGHQDVSLETKRKKLTVFFSELKNFTQITDDLEAEDLTGLLNEYFTEMSKIAPAHGATIDNFMGARCSCSSATPKPRGSRKTQLLAWRWQSPCSVECGNCNPCGAVVGSSSHCECASESIPATATSAISGALTGWTTRSSGAR